MNEPETRVTQRVINVTEELKTCANPNCRKGPFWGPTKQIYCSDSCRIRAHQLRTEAQKQDMDKVATSQQESAEPPGRVEEQEQ